MNFRKITQNYSSQPSLPVSAIFGEVTAGLDRILGTDSAGAGRRCILGFGSRGIPNYLEVCQATARYFIERGWEVAGVAAMGTHGGDEANAEIELLRSRHGITSESLGGVTMLRGTETVQIGTTARGVNVYLPKVALEFGGMLVPVNRIKPHTHTTRSQLGGIRRPRGSGVFKMLSIGFGKGTGAREVHSKAATFWEPPEVKDTETLGDVLEEVGRLVIDQQHVLAGVGIVDNASHSTAHVCVCDPATHFEDEIPWLQKADSYLPNIPLVPDALIISAIGKDISGTGAAPQVTRRWPDARKTSPCPAVVGILQLTEETHGSAFGIGFADVTTKALVRSIDVPFTEANTLGAGDPELGKPPALQVDSNEDVLSAAIELAAKRTGKPKEQVTVLYIQDTNSLEELYYSGPESLISELKRAPYVASVGEPAPIELV